MKTALNIFVKYLYSNSDIRLSKTVTQFRELISY
jgi:hypothetical protein